MEPSRIAANMKQQKTAQTTHTVTDLIQVRYATFKVCYQYETAGTLYSGTDLVQVKQLKLCNIQRLMPT